MFPSTDLHMKNYIANAVRSALQIRDKIVGNSNGAPDTFQTIVKLEHYSNVLQKTFNANYNEVLGSRKKALKTTTSICSGTAKYLQERLAMYTMFLKVLDYPKKDSNEKLHGQCPAVVRDTSRWRLSSLQHVRGENYAGEGCRDLGTFEKTTS